MGIFDGVGTAVSNAKSAFSSAQNFGNAAAVLGSYYAPQSAGYNSQIASSIASQAAAGRQYAGQSQGLYDDLDQRLGQVKLDQAGIGISRDANARQLGLLGQLQSTAEQRYLANQTYNGQQRGFINEARAIDEGRLGTAKEQIYSKGASQRRLSDSDATARGAMLSGGHRADIGDINLEQTYGLQNNWNDNRSSWLEQLKGLTGVNNASQTMAYDYYVDTINRNNDVSGIGDANKRLDLDQVNAALTAQGAQRNASTAKTVLDAQKAAQDAQAKAQLEQIQLQKIALWQQIVAQSQAAAAAAGGQ